MKMENMKNILMYGLVVLCVLVNISCEKNLLDKEQYHNVIYLKSDGNNIFSYTHMMNDSVSRGFLTVGSGGSMPLTADIVVTVELDTVRLNRYNFRNFGLDYAKYVQLVDSSLYVLPSRQIILKKGDPNMTTFFPIEIDANTLSPDTVYMIPFRIVDADGVEVNPQKNFVFYKPELANGYSSPKSRSYRMKGTRQTSDGLVSSMTITKNLLPLAHNRVRLFPDNLSPSTNLADIQNKAIVLIVEKDDQVRIKPFKNVMVEDLGASYYDPKEKVFNLDYRYRQPGQSAWISVKEVLTRVE